MRKNRAIIMALILFSMAHFAFAEQQDVCLEFHRWDIPDNNAKVNRAPMLLPIEAVYDSDNHIIKVIGYDSLNAEVFLYDSDGSVEGHSSTLNTEIPVMSSGSHTIQIQGDGWYAEGVIDVE